MSAPATTIATARVMAMILTTRLRALTSDPGGAGYAKNRPEEGRLVDPEHWAGAWYRVERASSGSFMRKSARRRATADAIEHGDPVPGEPHDVVRIYDREGNVVYERDWGAGRPNAAAQEGQIVDDLLHLEVNVFRAKYGIKLSEEPPKHESSAMLPPEPRVSEPTSDWGP